MSLLFLVVFSLCSVSNSSGFSVKYTKHLPAEDAFSLMADNKDDDNFVILDVRTPGACREGRIENVSAYELLCH